MQRFFHQFWSTFSFLFMSCNRLDIVFDVYKETTWKQVSEDEERQFKVKKQLFQVLINIYQWKLIDLGLYQRIRQH